MEERVIETDTEPIPVGGKQYNVEQTKYYDDRETNVYNRSGTFKRISWAAIFAGVVITLVTQLALSILGLGIGASAINPATEQNPMAGIGTGAGVWFALTTLISLFAGGWVAGRLAGIPRATDSLLHGILTWGLATLLLFYFLTSTVGAIIGGTFSVLGSGLSAAATGVASAAPQIAGAAQNQIQKNGVDISSIQREVLTTLRQTGKPALQPDAIQNQAQNAADQAQNTAANAASDPANSDESVTSLLQRIANSGEKTFNAADRDALVNVIMARTGKTRPEAEATVASYQKTYEQAQTQYEQTKAQAAAKAREIGQTTADTTSSAALWAFLALLLSAIAAALGGFLATPKDVPTRAEANA